MIGTITRWGARGYGFVVADDSTSEAWLHLKFVEDPAYQPRQGDRVDFVLEKLPDGRHQARRVRLVGSSPLPARPRALETVTPRDSPWSPATSLAPARSSVAIGAGALRAALIRAELVARPGSSAAPVERVVERKTIASLVPAAAMTNVLPVESLTVQLAAGRTIREGELERLRSESGELEQQIAQLEARRRVVALKIAEREASVLSEEARLVQAHLAAAAAGLEQALTDGRRLRDGFAAARIAAITSFGLPPVDHYLEIRKRLGEAQAKKDPLAESAFRLLERERRQILRELAEAHDRLDSAPSLSAVFTVLMPAAAGEPATLVAPLRARGLTPDGARSSARDPHTHMVCAFFHLAERAARELDVSEVRAAEDSSGGAAWSESSSAFPLEAPRLVLEHGHVAGCLAVRFASADPALIELLLEETWSGRPSLESSGIEPALEVVEGVRAAWESEPEAEAIEDESSLAAAGGTSTNGMALPDVSHRLGLSLRDLVALLYDRGLPFPDDAIESGTEDTLRALLGDALSEEAIESRSETNGEAETHQRATGGTVRDAAVSDDGELAAKPDSSGDEDLESGHVVAARMLRKLLRDRRVGGRHTRIENAYGHHFSDGEKLVARRVAEWLEKEGILLPKLNEGSHHISINPRRLREVGQIIEGTFAAGATLDQF